MMRKKKNWANILIFLVSIVVIFKIDIAMANSSLLPIRIAILDNFTAEKSSQKYKQSYFLGIMTASLAAKNRGFYLECKTFTYGSMPLDILVAIKEVKKWDPDLIIGPHSSNQFLLLPKYFKNVLVISPYATDEAVAKMPANFYSLSWPDSYMAKATVIFLEKYYPNYNVFNLAQADCKDCYDVSEIFEKIYKERYPNATVIKKYYVGNDVQNLNLSRYMKEYRPGSIIILQPLSYAAAGVLISSISNYLQQKNIIFIHNLDNWGNSSEAKKNKNEKYTAIRVCPLMEDSDSIIYKDFLVFYRNLFNSNSPNAVSYMTYATVMSVIDVLEKNPIEKKQKIKSAILLRFQRNLEKNSGWYRPRKFIYYELNESGEKKKEVIFNI